MAVVVGQDPETLFVMLVDEVETLTASREAALRGTDPSDAVKVVNSVLTEIDKLSSRVPNILICCTSNLVHNLDPAFLDRAGFKAFVGLPSAKARYCILRNSLLELMRVNLIVFPAALGRTLPRSLEAAQQVEAANPAIAALVNLARVESDGLSGRSLKSIAILAYSTLVRMRTKTVELDMMIEAMQRALRKEVNDLLTQT